MDVAQLLSNIKVNKASGPDNLQARLLQEVALEISPALTVIFQASLEQGALPNIWKSAEVVPIYKKGSRSDPGNYRPVSLTCICCKILNILYIPAYLNIYRTMKFCVMDNMDSDKNKAVSHNWSPPLMILPSVLMRRANVMSSY